MRGEAVLVLLVSVLVTSSLPAIEDGADLASSTLSSCHRDRICNTASLCGLPSQATFYRMMAKILLPVLCACVLVSGAPPKVPQESGPPCPALEIPDDAVVSVVVEGRVSLVRCGSVQHVLLCVSGRWSSQFPCSSQHTWNNLEAEHGEGWRAWNNVDAASHVEGGTFNELEAVSGVGRGREKRSPNTGKYEALRRRVKVQRKIRQGLLATTIDPSTPPLVSVHDGSDAFLLCRVQNLGGHSVSWIRQKDNRVIAIDSTVLVGDSRFLPSSEDQTETGFLRISGVRSYDAGDYECRVSTRPPLRKVVTLQVVPQGQPLHARDRDQPEERQEVNFLLKNISALWEEVNDLRQEVNHHLHQDHDESDHDNILRETGVLHHEHHVHHLRRPHESHNDHHDGELLDHLNTYHGHAQHQGHQESSDQNQQGESAEENDGEDDDGIDDDHDEGADDDDHSDHGDESHHTLGHDEDAHDHHGLHQDYDEYHEHGHEHGKEHGHGHERGHGHGHGGRGHGRGSHHHQHSEDGEEQSLGSPEAPERKPNDPWRRATCTLEPNAEMPSSDVRGSITISQRKDRKGPVYFDLDLTGFDVSLGRIHGFHVHEHSVRNNRCSTAGGHFNPYSETHGGPSSSTRHVGDLGNIEVEEDGELEGYIVSDNHVAFNGNSSIIGKAIVVHAGQDDLGLGGNAGSLTTGNAGGRLACCNIKRDRDFFFRFKG